VKWLLLPHNPANKPTASPVLLALIEVKEAIQPTYPGHEALASAMFLAASIGSSTRILLELNCIRFDNW
jgi:hypothetical protein